MTKCVITAYSFILVYLIIGLLFGLLHIPNIVAKFDGEESLYTQIKLPLSNTSAYFNICSFKINYLLSSVFLFFSFFISFIKREIWKENVRAALFFSLFFAGILAIIFLLFLNSGLLLYYGDNTAPIFEAIDKDGDGVDLLNLFYSNKLILLEFTSSYCGSCIQQTNVLFELNSNFNNNVTIASVCSARGIDTIDSMKNYVLAGNISWTYVYDVNDVGLDLYHFEIMPSMYLIKNGQIITHMNGLINYEDLMSAILLNTAN